MKTRVIKENFSDGKDFLKQDKLLENEISVHWHHFYEFDLVLSGSGETVLNGQSYPIGRGMVSLLSPMDFHEYRITAPTRIINVQFREKDIDCQILNRYLSLKHKLVLAPEQTVQNLEKLVGLLGSCEENAYEGAYNRRMIECMIMEFLSCCKDGEEQTVASTPMQRAIIYINTHFSENPSLGSLAEMFYLNPSYFSRNFKQHMGMTYKEYLRSLKLEYSRKLIRYTDLPMIDIAVKCGYDNQTHFNREFKAMYRQTPTSLRKPTC